MTDIHAILLPTDFSENSDVARKYACALAEQFEAELHMLNVIEGLAGSLPESVIMMAENLNDYMEQAEEKALERLAGVLEPDWKPPRRVTLATKTGSSFLQIIQYAKEHDVDLIVMGTHGRSGLSHALMGSVAERVVRHAPCPVLTVRPDEHEFVVP